MPTPPPSGALAAYVDQRGRALWRAAWLLVGEPDDADRAERLVADALRRAGRRAHLTDGSADAAAPLVRDGLVAALPRHRPAPRDARDPADPADAVDRALAARPRRDVPRTPDLAGLLAEATRRARRGRRARVAGALAVAATVAVAVPLAPRWVEGSRPVAAVGEAPTGSVVEVSTGCRTRADGELDHPDFLLGEAAWARFCVVGGSYPRPIGSALVPDALLTDGAATLVRGWQRAAGSDEPCRPTPSATKLAVQVGFEDGTVAEVYGETSACAAYTRPAPSARVVPGGQVYRELMTALAAQESPAGASGSTTAPSCPAAAPEAAGPVTDGPATGLTATAAAAAVLCTYDPADGLGAAPRSTALRATDAERVRVLALGAFDPMPGACTPDPAAPAHAVVVAGRDGATYEIGLDRGACDAVSVDADRLGVSPALAAALTALAAGS